MYVELDIKEGGLGEEQEQKVEAEACGRQAAQEGLG